MKKSKKLLAMLLALSVTITSGLVTGVVQAEGTTTTTLAPALAKTPGNSNPLITHKYGADPFAMVYKGRVYVYMTDDQAQWELTPDTANSYSNCRSISIISSADMVNWTDHGKVPVGGKVLADGVAKWATNAWAPAAAWRTIDGKDKFFLYFADNAGGIGVLEADSPVGPFHDPIGKQLISRSTPNCSSSTLPWLFDPAVLVDDKDADGDGVNDAFLYFGGGIDGLNANNPKSSRCVQLGNDMTSIIGTPAAIDAPRIFEDSGIHKYNGKYYYSYCSNFSGTNGDGYPPTGTIAYMESENPLGPFTYVGPILPGPGVFGNGDGGNNHHAIFQFGNDWYITYHTRQVNIAQRLANGQTGQKDYRSTSISKLSIATTGAITPLQMENKGISQLQNISPYDPTEAETIGWQGGITTEVCTEPSVTGSNVNMDVTSINNGDWIALGKTDFGTGAGTFTVKVASGSAGGTIELHLDSADGTLIGTLPVNYTGGENVWQNEITNVTGATGVHDLYMVFKGEGTSNLFKMDSWQFAQKSAKQLAGINASIDKLKIDTVSGTNTAAIKVMAIYTDGTIEDVTSQATVTPSQSGIVSINNGTVIGTSYGSISIDVNYSAKSDKLNLIVKDLKGEKTVKRLIVNNGKVQLDPGATANYTITAEFVDGHTEDITSKATLSNPNPNVATVAAGKITAVAGGTTDVIASFKGELGDAVTAQIYVTVTNLSAPIKFIIKNCNPVFEGPAKVSWGDNIGYLDAGTNGGPNGAVTFTVNVSKAGKYKMSVWNVVYGSCSHAYTINGGTPIIYTYPTDTTSFKLSPFSQDITLNQGDNTIKIAYNAGAAEIQYINLQSITSDTQNVPVTGLSLNKTSLLLKPGDSDTLTATIDPSTATDKNVTFVAEGSSVTLGQPVVNADGTTTVSVTATESGTAVVKAYAGGFESSCNVTVTAPVSNKPFTVGNGQLSRNGGITASVDVIPGVIAHSGNEVVLFQLMKGTTPVNIVALEKDVTAQEGFTAYFNVDPNDTTYTVRVYVFDKFNNDMTAPISLADSVILGK